MKFIFLCSFLFVVSASAVSFYSVVLEEWQEFKLLHGKKFDSRVEEKFRMKIFAQNKLRVAEHNQKYNEGKHSFALGLNEYADMLPLEFVKTMNGFHGNLSVIKNYRKKFSVSFVEPHDSVMFPESIDWRKEGAVTPIKNQGQCGSCWAFSATGSLEGQHYRQTKKMISLSEQNLIDCSGKYGNDGCNGGLMDYAFTYIKENHGIDTEKGYPYHADDEVCHFNPRNIGAEDKGYVDVRQFSEHALQKAVATVGPISVAIDASHSSFQLYKKGVYNEPECDSEQLDHGVLVVGYGTTKEGEDYWLVKNSWGESWGEEGYIKMARNKNNMCGIATSASYPLV